MSATEKRSLERKVLTFYGERGVNEADTGYSIHSIRRGYAGLNGRIHRLLLDNPELVLHSVSHDCVVLPDPYHTCICSATIVYSGTISDEATLLLPSDSHEGDEKRDLEDSHMGYGTIILETL